MKCKHGVQRSYYDKNGNAWQDVCALCTPEEIAEMDRWEINYGFARLPTPNGPVKPKNKMTGYADGFAALAFVFGIFIGSGYNAGYAMAASAFIILYS